MTGGDKIKDMIKTTKPSVVNEFDERPVLTNTKTFEEMLAEKLNLDKQAATTPNARQNIGMYILVMCHKVNRL